MHTTETNQLKSKLIQSLLLENKSNFVAFQIIFQKSLNHLQADAVT